MRLSGSVWNAQRTQSSAGAAGSSEVGAELSSHDSVAQESPSLLRPFEVKALEASLLEASLLEASLLDASLLEASLLDASLLDASLLVVSDGDVPDATTACRCWAGSSVSSSPSGRAPGRAQPVAANRATIRFVRACSLACNIPPLECSRRAMR
jgi:hypothetical protein